MSEPEDSKGRDDGKEICQDNIKNECKQDQDGKNLHPDEKEKDNGASNVQSKLIVFCHDYQNGKCFRYPCKFVHCSNEEEKYYKQTGELPARVLEDPFNEWIAVELLSAKMGETVPVCKHYISGSCTRRHCRFRHVTLRDLEATSNNRHDRSARPSYIEEEMLRRRNDRTRPYSDDYESIYKRRRLEDPYNSYPNDMRSAERTIYVLEEENSILRQHVTELRRRVYDLQATNEFLLEQNAQLRLNDKGATRLTAVTVPAVITNTAQMQSAQAPNEQVMNTAIATVPVSIDAVSGTPCSIATVHQPSEQNPSMSEPTGPLVSYPVMTRPVLQSDISH